MIERDERRRKAGEALGGPLTPAELAGDYILRGMPIPPDTRQRAHEGPPAPRSEATNPAPLSLPADAALIGYIEAYPRSSLARICHYFDVPLEVNIKGHDYTPEAKAIRRQLQRLRFARKIRSEGYRWVIW